MTTIITTNGFQPDEPGLTILAPEDFIESGIPNDQKKYGLDVTNTMNPERLTAWFDLVSLIRVPFPSFADGRGFSIARRLRELGFKGTIRAKGHILADQFPLALRCGFDEVEPDEDLLARQPEEQWLEALTYHPTTYQDRVLADA